MIVKTKAIVLHSRKYGESSKIITLFTEDHGKQTLIAKGARTAKSKYGSTIEPMSFLECTYYKKETRTLHILGSTSSIDLFKDIRRDMTATVIAMMILESAAITQDDNSENPELFELLSVCLAGIDSNINRAYNYFIFSQIKLVENLGFGLALSEVQNDYYIDVVLASGSLRNALSNDKYSFRFNREDYNMLLTILNSDFSELETIEIDKRSLMTYSNFFVKYFSFHLERKFKYKSIELLLL